MQVAPFGDFFSQASGFQKVEDRMLVSATKTRDTPGCLAYVET